MTWQNGNAVLDGASRRGWFVGHFLDASCGLRATDDVEMKWAFHAAGEARHEWMSGETRTACLILVHGFYRLALANGQVLLRETGDYVMWGPGEAHRWEAIDDSTVLTIRWPSTAL